MKTKNEIMEILECVTGKKLKAGKFPLTENIDISFFETLAAIFELETIQKYYDDCSVKSFVYKNYIFVFTFYTEIKKKNNVLIEKI